MKRRYEQIEINLGKACNNACVFCANGAVPRADRRFVPLELLREEIDRAAEGGYRALGLLGGEPTIHPQIREAVAHARARGFHRVALITNGRRLRNAPFLRDLVSAGVTRIALSIHHHKAEVADALSQRPGSHAAQVAAIQTLTAEMASGRVSLPHGFSANCCLHGRNVRQAVTFARFLRHLGVRDVRFNALRPEHLAVGNAELVPGLGRIRRAIEQLVTWNERQGGMHITFSDLPWCAFPPAMFWNPYLARRYLGDVHDLTTMVTAYRGEARERDHFDWKARRTAELKIKIAACGACRLEPHCEGIWTAYRDIHGDAGVTPIR